MPKELQIYVYEIEGQIVITPRTIMTPRVAQQSDEGEQTGSQIAVVIEYDEAETISKLNDKADETARGIETEIRRLLRSNVSVEADVRFYEGSILVQGSIMILSWLGPIAFKAAKQTIEVEFAQVVSIVTRRILQRTVKTVIGHLGSISDATVQAQLASSPPVQIDTESQLDKQVAPLSDRNVRNYLPYMNTVLILVLFIIQIILVSIVNQLIP